LDNSDLIWNGVAKPVSYALSRVASVRWFTNPTIIATSCVAVVHFLIWILDSKIKLIEDSRKESNSIKILRDVANEVFTRG
jgi:hypothetical protein